MTRVNLLNFTAPDGDEDPYFSRWWHAWPKEHWLAKGAARREWKKLKPSPQQAEMMTEAIQAQARGTRWKCGYVPTPANWLRDERWDDFVEPVAGEEDWRCHCVPPCPNNNWHQVVLAKKRGDA